MKRVYAVILPGGLLLVAALVFLRPGALPASMHPYVRAYPYVVAGAGIFLGWLFNRSRVVFAIVVLALADRALREFAAGDGMAAGVGHIGLDAIALLLPLNLLADGARTIRVLTPETPVARALIGKSVGDEVEFRKGQDRPQLVLLIV